MDSGDALRIFSELQSLLPEITLVGEYRDSVLLQAMATKDESEVERIRQVGKATVYVVAQVAELLSSHALNRGVLVDKEGEPLRIGQVKRQINRWLAEAGLENPEGTIFASGRDAAVPHSTGDPQALLRAGETIVFDIFPQEAGGGYFYDFTRTWCLQYAPDETLAIYEDVLVVYRQILAEIRAGGLALHFQQRACELFEARGHVTIQSNPETQEGYVHGLGHSLGLRVQERPMMVSFGSPQDRLEPGTVTTVEPGLYYPSRGIGVRLEDTLWLRPEGEAEILAPYPFDLVLPVKN